MKRTRRTERDPTPAPTRERAFRAGCGRTWSLVSAAADLAYTELEFDDCARCLHRVEPDGDRAFCTLRPEGTRHPFADLALLRLDD